MSILQWETLLCKIANEINSLPVARGDGSIDSSPIAGVITPNRLLLGHNNHRGLQGAVVIPPYLPSELLERNIKLQRIWYELMTALYHGEFHGL